MVHEVTNKDVYETSTKFQFLAALIVNGYTCGYGITCGWASPWIPVLRSDDSPLPSGKITMEEASLVAAIFCIGGLIGNLLFGFLTSRFGRKIPIMLLTVPQVAGWLLIVFAQNVSYLYAARLLLGMVGGGVFVTVPQFLSEIAVDRIRGVLGSTVVVLSNIGILLAFIFGSYLDYFTTPLVVVGLTIVCGVLLAFLPESPSFCVQSNKITDAEKSIRFYHSMGKSDRDDAQIQLKINKMRGSLGDSSDKGKSNESSMKLSDLTSGPGKTAMIIGIVLAALNQLCGVFGCLQYTSDIFAAAGSSLDPNTSAIIVGAIQLVGSYGATLLVDRGGRKILFLISTIGIALGEISLGVYMWLKSSGYDVDALNFVPIAAFSFVIFIANWAVLSLPFLVISEILPIKLKDFGASFCMTVLWSCAFLVIKFLPLMQDLFGFHGTMFIFSSVCILSAIFIFIRLPETKGKTHDEIMKALE